MHEPRDERRQPADSDVIRKMEFAAADGAPVRRRILPRLCALAGGGGGTTEAPESSADRCDVNIRR